MRTTLSVATLLLLAACASTTGNLSRETARTIGGNTSPDAVTVSDVERGPTTVRWKALVGGTTYACSADDMVTRPYCVRQ